MKQPYRTDPGSTTNEGDPRLPNGREKKKKKNTPPPRNALRWHEQANPAQKNDLEQEVSPTPKETKDKLNFGDGFLPALRNGTCPRKRKSQRATQMVCFITWSIQMMMGGTTRPRSDEKPNNSSSPKRLLLMD